MIIKFIGDVHGSWQDLEQILREHKDTDYFVQVGDMNLGFPSLYTYRNLKTNKTITKETPPDPTEFPNNFKFIRGNHDCPETCGKHTNYLGDYGFNDKIGKDGLFYISGGYSTDSGNRTEGLDWWRREELSHEDLQDCVEQYSQIKPKIVVSHECPTFVQKELCDSIHGYSRTAMALSEMFKIHQPLQWYFGHHHKSYRSVHNNTLFVCCGVNQVVAQQGG